MAAPSRCEQAVAAVALGSTVHIVKNFNRVNLYEIAAEDRSKLLRPPDDVSLHSDKVCALGDKGCLL